MCNCTNTRQQKQCQLHLWLTVNLPNLCISVYILRYRPGWQPARPPDCVRMCARLGADDALSAAVSHQMMCLYILRCNRCCASPQLCQLLCYQLPFLQNDVTARVLKLSLRCSADASFLTSPLVFKSNVGLHPLNSKAVPHMFCYRRLSLVM